MIFTLAVIVVDREFAHKVESDILDEKLLRYRHVTVNHI